jgi:hypothetical protein
MARVLPFLLLLATGNAALGQEPQAALTGQPQPVVTAQPTVAAGQETAAPAAVPWRGSTLTYRNVASTISLWKDEDLTWNPYYAMAVDFAPRWWFGSVLYVTADIAATRELTEADDTTRRGETWLDDVTFKVGASRLVTIPFVGIDVSLGLTGIAPTSKLSLARTLIVGVRPDLTLARRFDLLAGASLSYTLTGTRYFNRYTTAERDSPLIPGCSGADCDVLVNTGERNPKWRVSHLFAASLDFTDWLGLSADAGIITDWLYDAAATDPLVSHVPQEPQDRRYLMVYEAELTGRPWAPLTLAAGASTVSPQLRPDSSPEAPVVNRYTTVYFDVRFDFGELFAL